MDSYASSEKIFTGKANAWRIRKNVRKRWRYGAVVVFSTIVSLCLIIPLYQDKQHPLPRVSQVLTVKDKHDIRQQEFKNQENGLVQSSSSLAINKMAGSNSDHLPLAIQRRILQFSQDTSTTANDVSLANSNASVDYSTSSTTVTITEAMGNEFPEDIFSDDQLKSGAVVMHIIGIIYMFIALAITCDEFFVPSLEVITTSLGISEDVAGATFMAAGGSAPELFTSFIGIFAARSEVGIGTILGSAVFNILFVIGMCAVVSRGVLHLTWWPLFRDVSFYSITLILLIVFFLDQKIHWWEALILFLCYIAYVSFMKFNKTAEKAFKKLCGFKPPVSSDADAEVSSKEGRGPGVDMVQEAGNSAFRQGLLHLLLKTMDPLDNSQVSEAPRRLQAIAEGTIQSTSPSQVDSPHSEQSPPDSTYSRQSQRDSAHSHQSATSQRSNGFSNEVSCGAIVIEGPTQSPVQEKSHSAAVSTISIHSNGNGNSARGHTQIHNHGVASGIKAVVNSLTPVADGGIFTVENGVKRPSIPDNNGIVGFSCGQNGREPGVQMSTLDVDIVTQNTVLAGVRNGRGRLNTLGTISKQDLPADEPLDLSWPGTWKKRFIYIILIPISIPLAFTLPDVRKKSSKKWFPWTFLGSILWIGTYSYLMNWWASIVGDVIGIKPAVMGMTFLAAGTSIPDLITSVIVAKKGLGDMAVSSSVGSNIFDVTVGLPLPWLIYGLLYEMPYTVNSKGLLCSVILLFTMLTLLIIVIAAFKWQMNQQMGIAMFFMYLVFICLALLLYYEKIPCPSVVL